MLPAASFGTAPGQAPGLAPEAGALRLSFVHYTSPEEIDKLIKALDASL